MNEYDGNQYLVVLITAGLLGFLMGAVMGFIVGSMMC